MNNQINTKHNIILPPATLGILGGGQLGMMFAVAAKSMGYRVVILDPDPDAPAKRFADQHICKAYDDPESLQELKKCAAVTTEFENVNVGLMEQLTSLVRVLPAARCVAISQHRVLEKQTINQAGLKTAPYHIIESLSDCNQNCLDLLPGILKTATLGYDGKGQVLVNNLQELQRAFSDLQQVLCILEKKLNLCSDVSVIVCRLDEKTIECFPVADNVHINGILFTSTVPSSLDQQTQDQLQKKAIQLANYLDYKGVLAVEFFIVDDSERIYVNEIAPRPHNSGHYTLNATFCSQFEQQVRILCGLPPLKTTLLTACTMVNLLGNLWKPNKREPQWQILLQDTNVHLHLYAKKIAKPNRKMGHFNVLNKNSSLSLSNALNLYTILESN